MKWLKRLGWLLGGFLALVLVLKVAAEIRTAVVFEPRPLRLDDPDLALTPDLTLFTQIESLMDGVAPFPRDGGRVRRGSSERGRSRRDEVSTVDLAEQRHAWFATHKESLASLEALMRKAGPSQLGQPRIPISIESGNPFNYLVLKKAFELLIFELEQGLIPPSRRGHDRLLAIQNLCDLWRNSGEFKGILMGSSLYDRFLVCLNRFLPSNVPLEFVERIPTWGDWSQALKLALLREGKTSADMMRELPLIFGREMLLFSFFDLYHAEHTAQLIDQNFQAIVSFDDATGSGLNFEETGYENQSLWNFNHVGRVLAPSGLGMYDVFIQKVGMVAVKGQMEVIRLTADNDATYRARLAEAIDPFTGKPFHLDASGRVLISVTGHPDQPANDVVLSLGESFGPQWGKSPYGETYPGIVLVD